MPDQAAPTDREFQAAMVKIKESRALRARMTQSHTGDRPRVEEALQTVETWATDKADDGAAWGARRDKETREQIAEGERWRATLRTDDQQAEAEAETRSNMDMDEIKAEMRKTIDDYQAKIKEQADNDQAWAKKKLADVARENAEARKFVDEKLEKTLDMSAKVSADRRRKNKLIGDQMIKQGDDARAWREQYADQSAKWAVGQREDVGRVLDEIKTWAEGNTADIKPLGSKAAPHVEALKEIQAWVKTQKQQTAAHTAPPDVAKVKQSGMAGVQLTRLSKVNLETFLDETMAEGEAGNEVFARWTAHNNRRANTWIKSDSAKHRKWAEEWLKTQE